MELLPEGLMLEAETYNALITTMRRDCRVLESFRIMDYSLLIGVHNLDQSAKEQAVSFFFPFLSLFPGNESRTQAALARDFYNYTSFFSKYFFGCKNV